MKEENKPNKKELKDTAVKEPEIEKKIIKTTKTSTEMAKTI